jgi:hypothetical protein
MFFLWFRVVEKKSKNCPDLGFWKLVLTGMSRGWCSGRLWSQIFIKVLKQIPTQITARVVRSHFS